MEDCISMSIKELNYLEIISSVDKKSLTQTQAAESLSLTNRQIRRLLKRYRIQGPIGLISKKRGATGNHRLKTSLKELVLSLINTHYHPTNPTFAFEKLTEVHKLKISLSSVRKIMIDNDLWSETKAKKIRIHQLRQRRPREGELQQIDGSPHAWFEDRGPKCSLLYCIDDATGKIKAALFAPSEGLWPYYRLMEQYLKIHGRPIALYSDKHTTFRVNHKEALTGNGLTQFGKAMKELDITMIFAHSPQAKGRIERANRTLQNRLVQEFRLHNISDIDAANAFLPNFIEDFNRRFAVTANNPDNAHRPLLDSHDLTKLFTEKYERTLSKNLIFQYNNTIYQIKTSKQKYTLNKAKIIVQQGPQGEVSVFYKNQPLEFTAVFQQERQGAVVDSKNLNECVNHLQESIKIEENNQPYRPSRKHPWKKGFKRSLSKACT